MWTHQPGFSSDWKLLWRFNILCCCCIGFLTNICVQLVAPCCSFRCIRDHITIARLKNLLFNHETGSLVYILNSTIKLVVIEFLMSPLNLDSFPCKALTRILISAMQEQFFKNAPTSTCCLSTIKGRPSQTLFVAHPLKHEKVFKSLETHINQFRRQKLFLHLHSADVNLQNLCFHLHHPVHSTSLLQKCHSTKTYWPNAFLQIYCKWVAECLVIILLKVEDDLRSRK